MTDVIRLSAVQAASAFFDKQAALQIALDWIDRAAKEKPDVIALGEAWLPGYPFFIDSPLGCLLYTSPSPRDQRGSRMPSSA